MNRPYVICHILSSLDGKINGPFMTTEATRALGEEYGKIRTKMNADAWLYGTTTVKEFLNFQEPILDKNSDKEMNTSEESPLNFPKLSSEENPNILTKDFVADDKPKPYFVALDTKGELGWQSGRFANKGRKEAHVIEILTEATPLSYCSYLRKRGVSYILAGKTELDCKIAMEKLYQLFHIEKLLICGGGIADWTFLQAGMVDELSLVLSPVTDGNSGKASSFTQLPSQSPEKPIQFTLKTVKHLGNGGLHITYLVKNTR